MLNLNHLYYFSVAAECKTITNAAKILGISQPALTAQIKLLESALGHGLFRKSGRNVFLTAEGERLYRLSKPIFQSVAELERRFKQTDESRLQLRIGFTEQIEGVFVEELVAQILSFKRWKERPKLIVTTGRIERVVSQLRAHELDLAFSNTGSVDPEIVTVQKFDMPVGLYLSSAEKRKSPGKSASELWRDPSLGLALPNSQVGLRSEIDEYLYQNQFKKNIAFESDTLSLVTRAVIDHVGMGLFPKPYMQEEERLKRVVCVSGKDPLWHHSLFLLSHLRFEQTPAIKDMILSIRKHFSIVEHSKPAK